MKSSGLKERGKENKSTKIYGKHSFIKLKHLNVIQIVWNNLTSIINLHQNGCLTVKTNTWNHTQAFLPRHWYNKFF